MIADLACEAAKYGLKIHTGKTVVLTNASGPCPAVMDLHGQHVQIVSGTASQKYLGRLLSMDEPHQTELSNRIACGWAAFLQVSPCCAREGFRCLIGFAS